MNKVLAIIIFISIVGCSKSSPYIEKTVKKEMPADKVVVYMSIDHEEAANKLANSNNSKFEETLSEIVLASKKGFRWDKFWKILIWDKNSLTDKKADKFSKLLKISKYSCDENASKSFVRFYKKAIQNYNKFDQAVSSEFFLNHFLRCEISISKFNLSDSLEKQVRSGRVSFNLLKKYVQLNPNPTNVELQKINEYFLGSKQLSEKNASYAMNAHKLFKENIGYQSIKSNALNQMSFSELKDNNAFSSMSLDEFLNITNIFRWEIINESSDYFSYIMTLYSSFIKKESSTLEQVRLYNSQFSMLKDYELIGGNGMSFVSHINEFSESFLNSFENIKNSLNANEVLYRFGLMMSGKRIDLKIDRPSNVEKLLALRALIQIEGQSHVLKKLTASFCEVLENLGVEKDDVLNPLDIMPIGCTSYNKEQPLQLSKSVKMGLFSSIQTNGADIEIIESSSSFSIIDLSQSKQRAPLGSVVTEDKYNTIAIPLVVGLRPIVDSREFKANNTYYISFFHLYRDSRKLRPGTEGMKKPLDGYPGGNLITKKGIVKNRWLKFISSGGEGQKASPGKEGGLGLSAKIDRIKVRKWINSFSGHHSFYISDTRKTKRNLEKLINSSLSSDNQLNIYIDPGYLSVLGPNLKEMLLLGIKDIIKSEGLLEVDTVTVLEMLARRSIRSLISKLNNVNYSDDLEHSIPEIMSKILIDQGPVGEKLENGNKGKDGEIIYN